MSMFGIFVKKIKVTSKSIKTDFFILVYFAVTLDYFSVAGKREKYYTKYF